MIQSNNITIVNSNISLEALTSIYLYNLQYQPIVSPYFVKYEPYDFQKYSLLKSIRNEEIKIFLADEVGLGKTIEALLIIQELILKNDYRKILIILPKNLIKQWETEINNWTYFNYQLTHYMVDGTSDLIKTISDKDKKDILLLCSKGLLVYKNNFAKNEINWDLIVVDEAHHARSEEYYSSFEERTLEKRNQFYRCLKLLGGRSKSMLFLSATPIQLNINEFKKLIQIKNEELFQEFSFDKYQTYHSFLKILFLLIDELNNENSKIDKIIILKNVNELISAPEYVKFWETLITKYNLLNGDSIENCINSKQNIERIKYCLKKEHLYCKILIRNRKRDIFKKLKERCIADFPVEMHKTYKDVYLKIDELVSKFQDDIVEDPEGNIRFKRAIKGYLLSSYREYMASSKEQIKKSLNNRKLKKLEKRVPNYEFSEEFQKINNIIIELKNLKIEYDNKLNKLCEILEELKENNRIIIFAKYYATIDYLKEKLEGFHKKNLYILTGEHTPTSEKRTELINEFNEKGGILLSTDIGGEGLNLQSANVIINYDLHWNPTKLEQRVGRIDRIGQDKKVYVYNIYYKDSVAGRIYTLLKKRINFQTQSLGEIDPILDEISEEIWQNAINENIFEPLLEDKVNSYNEEIDKKVKEYKKDLILKEESYNEAHFNELKMYLPIFSFNILLNYINLLMKNHNYLIYQDFHDYFDYQQFYLENFVYYINRKSPFWENIIKTIKSPYFNIVSQHINFEKYNRYHIKLPKHDNAINYYHGIGDPFINLLINYFGLKNLKNNEILFSKAIIPNLKEEGYIFFYQVEFDSVFIKQNIIIPLFFNNNNCYKEDFNKNLLMELLTKSFFIRNNPDPRVDYTQINNLSLDSVVNSELVKFENILLKEHDLIKDQRIYNVQSNFNFLINKKNKDLVSFFIKKFNLENKINLSRFEQSELKYINTRIETLQKNLKLLNKEKDEKSIKLKNSTKGNISHKLILILKLEQDLQKSGELFNISDPFENQSEEIYIGQEFSYKINCLQDLKQFFDENDDLRFQIKMNNYIINSNKIDVGTLNRNRTHEISFIIKGDITDFVNIALYCVSNSNQILLSSNDNIKIHLFSLFIEENGVLNNITGKKDNIIDIYKKYFFFIKSQKSINEIHLYMKDENEIDEFVNSLPLEFVKCEGNLNIYKVDYIFNEFGNYFFRILGTNYDSNLLVIPDLSIEFPDITKTDNFIISELTDIFVLIRSIKSVYTENFLKNFYFTLNNKKSQEICNINLKSIPNIYNQLINSKNQDLIKIAFCSFVPADIDKLRLGEYTLILKFFNYPLKSFNFKLFPIIIFSNFESLKLFERKYEQDIKIILKDPEHVLIKPYLIYKNQETKYKYFNQKEQIDCEFGAPIDISNRENVYCISIIPNLLHLLAGEHYELKINTNYQIHYGNDFPGPTLYLGDFGVNRIGSYDGIASKYLLFYNTGFKSVSINGEINNLDRGFNTFRLSDNYNIKIDNNGNFLEEFHLIKNENFDINPIIKELTPYITKLTPKIYDFLSESLKQIKSQDFSNQLILINNQDLNFGKFLLDSMKFFDNIYVIYPTVELFQDEISTVIKEVALDADFNNININLITYPAPLENIVYDEKKEDLYQRRKIIPIILEKCYKCGCIIKYDKNTKKFHCKCNNDLTFEQLPEIYGISSKILLKCPICNQNLKILYYKNKKIEFSCEACDFSAQNINILFNRFKFSQVNSINFMTIEQFDYSISHAIIENKEIKNIQLELLNTLKLKEEQVRKYWKENYPQDLKNLKDKYTNLKKKISEYKQDIKVEEIKPLKPQKIFKKISLKKIIKSIFKFIKKVFAKKHNISMKSVKNEKNITDSHSKKYLNKELIDEYKKIEEKYNEISTKWKNKIRSFIEIDIMNQSKELTKIEEDDIDDLIKIDEFDFLEEMEVSNKNIPLNKNYLILNSIKYLQNLGLINDYLDLEENYLDIIDKILTNQSEFQMNNLFIFMDLNNVKETENEYIKNYTYVKNQLINFNNVFCQSTNNNIGLGFY